MTTDLKSDQLDVLPARLFEVSKDEQGKVVSWEPNPELMISIQDAIYGAFPKEENHRVRGVVLIFEETSND